MDFAAGVVRLDVGSTKNRAGRVFPFAVLPALKALLERQRRGGSVQESNLPSPLRGPAGFEVPAALGHRAPNGHHVTHHRRFARSATRPERHP